MAYGYLWRILTEKCIYMASGAFGQETFVIPSEGLVLGIQCAEGTDSNRLNKLIDECILSYM